jgi:hypothetical protein
MTSTRPDTRSRWCIVVADAAGPEWPISQNTNAQSAPVQFCSFEEPTTMLQKALHRAVRISHAGRVMVTAAEAHRSHWQQALWFMRSEHRFVSEFPGWSLLTTAAAVVSFVAYGAQQAQLKSLTEQAQASRRAADLADTQYREGVADFLILLDAQRTQLDAEDSVAQAETAVNVSVVAIYKALGGVGQPLKDAPIKMARVP